jgi:hypothetical protein
MSELNSGRFTLPQDKEYVETCITKSALSTQCRAKALCIFIIESNESSNESIVQSPVQIVFLPRNKTSQLRGQKRVTVSFPYILFIKHDSHWSERKLYLVIFGLLLKRSFHARDFFRLKYDVNNNKVSQKSNQIRYHTNQNQNTPKRIKIC